MGEHSIVYQGRLFTIGHSNRNIDTFLSLLRESGVSSIVDIRAYPQSRRYPHFSQQHLKQSLQHQGIQYHWEGRQLGGMRRPGAGNQHPGLANDSMKGFAEYMQQPAFETAIHKLINLSGKSTTAICCAEKEPSLCHRTLISDYLTLKKIEVIHIVDVGSIRSHTFSESARIDSFQLIYDRNTNHGLDLN